METPQYRLRATAAANAARAGGSDLPVLSTPLLVVLRPATPQSPLHSDMGRDAHAEDALAGGASALPWGRSAGAHTAPELVRLVEPADTLERMLKVNGAWWWCLLPDLLLRLPTAVAVC